MSKKLKTFKKLKPFERKILAAFEKVLEIVGSKSELARELNLSRQAVTDWNLLKIPIDHVIAMEKITKLKVKREDLRPKLYE